MTLITPNFADKAKSGEAPQGNGAAAPVHVVEQHEPLRSNPFAAGTQLPVFPQLEQKVNVAPVAEPAPLKVALVGTAPSSRMLAPYNDPSWKIWGCSPGNQNVLPRADAWFELHANLMWPQYKHYGEPYIAWLKQLTIPVFMQDKSQVPNANIFPKDEMVKEFGPYFFTSSFAWMMAYAIKLGAKEVALYGIDMASHDEYIIQRPGAYYFFIEAAKRGCKVWAPYESDILQPPGLYGYADIEPFQRKMLAREDELGARIAPLEQQFAKMQQDLNFLRGAKENQTYLREIWFGVNDSGKGYLDQLLEKTKSPESQG